MEKYIFLDVDGVLNGQHSFNETSLYPFYLNNLKKLINKTNAKIILSSSWRNFLHKENNKYISNKKGGYGEKLIKAFENLNLEIHDTTKLGYSTKILFLMMMKICLLNNLNILLKQNLMANLLKMKD